MEITNPSSPVPAGSWSTAWVGWVLSLGLLIPGVGFGQTNKPPVAAAAEMTAAQVELQKKLGAATAAAQKDPAVQAAFQKAMQLMREYDQLLYKKIKQIDPSLTDFVQTMLKAKYPDAGQGK